VPREPVVANGMSDGAGPTWPSARGRACSREAVDMTPDKRWTDGGVGPACGPRARTLPELIQETRRMASTGSAQETAGVVKIVVGDRCYE